MLSWRQRRPSRNCRRSKIPLLLLLLNGAKVRATIETAAAVVVGWDLRVDEGGEGDDDDHGGPPPHVHEKKTER